MATVSKTAWDEAPKMKFASRVAIATLLASSIGLLALGIVNIYSDVDAGFKQWITLNAGIGPYSGKELSSSQAGSGVGWSSISRCGTAS